MKKIIPLIVFALAATIWAEDPGVQAQVELVSGTRQKARFLGIQNDTVSLGGYIQNQFTIVKIAKNKFKRIVDEKGNDLLNGSITNAASKTEPKIEPQAKAAEAVPAQAKNAASEAKASPEVPLRTTQKEARTAMQAPTTTGTSAKQDAATAAASTNTEVEVTTAFIAYDFKNGDSTIATQMSALTARLLRENSETPQVFRRDNFTDCDDNICIQNKLYAKGISTIYFGNIQAIAKTDSLNVSLKRVFYEDSLPTIHMSQMTISSANFLSDALTAEKMKNFILDAQGLDAKNKNTKSYIHIETDPEGATISRSEKNSICKSPCTFAVRDTGKFSLHAFWKVDQHLWGASTNIIPIPGDTVKTSLKLKKIAPEIRIVTHPDDAEIYQGGTDITKHSKPLTRSPDKVYAMDMGYDSLLIRRPGFRDTTVSFYIAPVPQIDLNIDLEKVTDYDEIEQQKKWMHDRKMLHIGQGLIGGAIGSAIVGALFLYLAHQDYSDADDIKSELSTPGSLQGENFKNKLKRNHDLVDNGEQKVIIGGTLIGAGAILFGFGLYLTF